MQNCKIKVKRTLKRKITGLGIGPWEKRLTPKQSFNSIATKIKLKEKTRGARCQT